MNINAIEIENVKGIGHGRFELQLAEWEDGGVRSKKWRSYWAKRFGHAK